MFGSAGRDGTDKEMQVVNRWPGNTTRDPRVYLVITYHVSVYHEVIYDCLLVLEELRTFRV